MGINTTQSLTALRGGQIQRGSWSGKQSGRMDVELFLDECPRWEVNSPHHPLILHEMFQHAAEQGQKEVEHMIC